MNKITFKNVLIGVVIILLLLVFKDWWKPALISSLGGYNEKKVETIIDSVKTIDTVFLPQIKRKVVATSPVRKGLEDKDYLELLKKYKEKLEELEDKPTAKDSIYKFKTSIKDTLIEGDIVTFINGKTATIIDQYLDYKPLYPIIVKERTTINTTTTNTLTKDNRIKIGIGVEASTIETVGLKGVIQINDGWQFQAGYNKSLNNNLIWRQQPVNGFGTITIIKTF